MTRTVADTCKLLGDETRLRLLALLDQEELAVQELGTITGLGQSRISHHLALLRKAGVVGDRREGAWTFYRRLPEGQNGALPADLWKAVSAPYLASGQSQEDRAVLADVRAARRERSRQAHDDLAGVWRLVGQDLERGSLRSEVLGALAPRGLTVADLGCGAGFFAHYLGERVARVIAVDHSAAMLREARAGDPGRGAIEYRRGELDALPLADAEVDAVVANLVLHHIADFHPVIAEMARVLRPGGVVVVTDLRPHGEEWMREEMGDLRLGIDPQAVAQALAAGPFTQVQELTLDDRYRMRSRRGRTARLELFMVRGLAPGGVAPPQARG